MDISRSQLQAVIGLPLSQAVTQRETFKEPLRSAYQRQISRIDKDCQAESQQGQQPYNICMGQVEQQADNDFALFYNNLQMLCHDQDQLTTLQASEKVWRLVSGERRKSNACGVARRERVTGIRYPGAAVPCT